MPDTTRHEARIFDLDREASGNASATPLLAPALQDIRRGDFLAFWVGAYRALAAGVPADVILQRRGTGYDFTGWQRPATDPTELRAWREREGLTQGAAAKVAGVGVRAWERWEAGDRDLPHWLRDVLEYRWGSSPAGIVQKAL